MCYSLRPTHRHRYPGDVFHSALAVVSAAIGLSLIWFLRPQPAVAYAIGVLALLPPLLWWLRGRRKQGAADAEAESAGGHEEPGYIHQSHMTALNHDLVSRTCGFVGGALSVQALYGLGWLVRGLAAQDMGLILPSIYIVLGLPLGLGLLFRQVTAIRLTKIYLWISVVLQGTALVLGLFHVFPPEISNVDWESVATLVGMVALLVVFLMGQSHYKVSVPER
jgi:hypothetical protein